MLLHLFSVCIFPLTVGVFCIEIVLGLRRDKRRGFFLGKKFVPIEIFEPDVLLHFVWSIKTQSASRFALDEFVDKISSLTTPTLGNFLLFDLYLLRQNVVSDFLTVLTLIGTFAKHAFVGNNSHRKVVHCHAVILATHDFGRHVAGRTTGVFCILGVPNSSDAEISDPEIAMLVKNQVFRLDVSVKDAVFVQVLKAQEHAGDKKL